jgi:hypothetical protein
MPTLAGFQWFITNIMGITALVLPTNSPVIAYVYGLSTSTVNTQLAAVGGDIYSQAVYNLAGDFLINYAQDQTGQTFFSYARATFHVNDFVSGVVTSAGDSSTSDSLEVPEQFKSFTLADLQNLKTPWGRTYLALAQKVGNLWGVS